MQGLKFLGIAILLVVFAGCSDPTIDASSDESTKASIAKVRQALPESQQEAFDEAVKVLAFGNIDMEDLMTAGVTGGGTLIEKARQSLDGKTGEEVIAAAERLRGEREEQERQQELAEIRELQAKRAQVASARENLEEFYVLHARFYFRARRHRGKEPVIELTVQNNTRKSVARAYFEGRLTSYGRSVPWHKGTFNYSIPGGLEQGEKATWRLVPNRISDWWRVDAPTDANFAVTVQKLDGADGEPLYSARGFSERERRRLSELKKKYGVE